MIVDVSAGNEIDAGDQDSSRWLTPRELSELLMVKIETLASWRSLGKGPPYRKLGRNCFYVAEECIRWRNEIAVVCRPGSRMAVTRSGPGDTPGEGNKYPIPARQDAVSRAPTQELRAKEAM